MKEYIRTLVCTTLVAAFTAFAQDSTAHAKLDTVIANQKAMMELQQKTYQEVRYDEPLAKKSAGVEVNLARLLFSGNADVAISFSGTVSMFALDRSAEIAFPILYQKGFADYPSNTLLNIDFSYRRFLGRHQDGLYFSGNVRYTNLDGLEAKPFIWFGTPPPQEHITTSKVGVAFGIGYRYFSVSGLYWGTSLIYGKYFSDDVRDVGGVLGDDSKIILDIELLKFGLAF